MPFTVNVGPYQGGNFLFQGLSSVGEGAAKALAQLEENRKLDAYNDTVIQHAFQNKQMSREDYDKYIGSSRTAKTGIAAGLAANFVEDMKAEQLRSMQEARAASIALRQQQADALNWQPSQADLDQARWTGNELLHTGPGKFNPTPYGGSGQDKVIVDPLEIGGKVIPGWGVNRKTGQWNNFAGSSDVKIDPTTQTPYWIDPKGVRHDMTSQQVMAGQMMAHATPSPTPQMSMDDAIKQQLDNISTGQMPTATPAASQTPVPSATPAPQGGEAVPVTATGPVPPAQVQAAAIKEAFKAGKMTREEAMKALRELGFK